MVSPFPGMDPYLEGYQWPDVHQRLASQISRQIAPLISPNYVVRFSVTMLYDQVLTQELGVMYPDVEIMRPYRPSPAEGFEYESDSSVAVASPAMTIPLPIATPMRSVTTEIRDVARNQLVTAIEVISPANKREPGMSTYLAKRDEVRAANVHLLELDFIRRGKRLWSDEHIPPTPYLAVLMRARRVRAEVWPISLRERLPVLPIPLRAPDSDVPLDLQLAFDTIYDEARYDLTIAYDAPPPEPTLSDEDAAWVMERLQQWKV